MNQEQVRSIFRAAIELNGTARDEYVAVACAEDAALADQVRRLLRGADADTQALRPSGDLLEPGVPRVPGYELGDRLGDGGMGTVYRAREVETGDTVAIKVLHPWLCPSPRSLERFRREGAIGQRVSHPHVVRTRRHLTAGRHPCIVMDYIEGRTLRGLLDDLGRVPESLLREIARQIATGLHAIHAAGILHRDLKPENVLINDERQVQIMDLGVAKLANDSIDLTRDGQFVGSLAYAAPEQFDGPDVEARADLYAFGVLLYELAAGANPFRFDEPLASIRAHKEVPLAPLHLAEPGVSPFFSDVVATLTEKAPEDRFRSAAEFLEVLAEGEDGPWWRSRERRFEPGVPSGMLRAASPGAVTALVGREAPLRRLQSIWEKARRGPGTTVLVRGESGSGKTRLVHDWAARLPADQVHVLYGSFPPEGGVQALVHAVQEQFGTRDIRRALAPYLPGDALQSALAARIDDTVAPGDAGPDAFAAALAQLLRALCLDRPVVWIVDDYHFATNEGSAAVQAMARAVRPCRAMLVVTSRPTGPDSAARLRLAGVQPERIDLERLTRDDVAALLADAFGDDQLADQLADTVHAKSEGVPYFVLQIVRALEAQGIVERDAQGRARLVRLGNDLETPDAVTEIVRDRLDELEPDHRRILDAASICGLEFEGDLVSEIVSVPLIHVLQDLAEIERRQGIVRSRGRRFRFDHHVVHESLAAAVPPRLGEALHARAGEVLAARAGEDPAPADAFAIVRHFLRGSEPARALPHLERALAFAEGRGELGVELCRAALAADGLLAGAKRIEMLRTLARFAESQGRVEEECAAAREALDIAERLGEDRLLGPALVDSWRAQRHQREFADKEEYLRRALAIAERCQDRETEGRACGNLSLVLWQTQRPEESEAMAKRARAIFAATGNRELDAVVVLGQSGRLRNEGRLEEALALQDEALRIGEEFGHPRVQIYAQGNRAVTLRGLGRFREALAALRIQSDLAERFADFRGEMYAVANRGTVEFALGRAGDALQSYRHARDLAALCNDFRTESSNLCAIAFAHMVFGDLEAAGDALDQAQALVDDHGLSRLDAEVLLQRAHLTRQRGDLEGGIELCRRALELARQGRDAHVETGAFLGLGCMLEDAGRSHDARDAFRQGREVAARTNREQQVLRFDLYLVEDPAEYPALRERLEQLNERIDANVRLEFRYVLYEETGEVADLIEARRLLQKFRAQAPAACRDTMVERSFLFRRIEQAWNRLA